MGAANPVGCRRILAGNPVAVADDVAVVRRMEIGCRVIGVGCSEPAVHERNWYDREEDACTDAADQCESVLCCAHG